MWRPRLRAHAQQKLSYRAAWEQSLAVHFETDSTPLQCFLNHGHHCDFEEEQGVRGGHLSIRLVSLVSSAIRIVRHTTLTLVSQPPTIQPRKRSSCGSLTLLFLSLDAWVVSPEVIRTLKETKANTATVFCRVCTVVDRWPTVTQTECCFPVSRPAKHHQCLCLWDERRPRRLGQWAELL